MNKFALSALGFFAAAVTAYAQPKMEVVSEYDWGRVVPKGTPTAGIELTAAIKIKNVGTELLRITGVKPGCGCTTAPLDKDTLQPGEVATVNVKLNIGSNVGPVTKGITISSNDPANATKYLYLKANVERPIQLSSPYLTFEADKPVGQEAVARLTISNTSAKDMVIRQLAATNDVALNATGPITVKAGGAYEIVAKYRPKAKGTYTTTLSVKTDNADYPSFELNGYGTAIDAPTSPAVNPQPK